MAEQAGRKYDFSARPLRLYENLKGLFLQSHHKLENPVAALRQMFVCVFGVEVNRFGRCDLVVGGKLGGGGADIVA